MKTSAMKTPYTRRDFLAQMGLAGSALALGARANGAEKAGAPAAAAAGGKRRWPIIAFSKPFQQLSAEETADFIADIGWDGIECPVRAKGQIDPERAADDLPKFAATLRSRGLDVHMITTDITSMKQPFAEKVMRAAAQAGIRRLRLGTWKYDLKRSIPEQVKEIGAAVRDIAAAAKDLGLQAGIENHNGRDHVAAPIWDVYLMVRELDPAAMGICFDIGHATIEGGTSWPIQAKLMAPYYTAVYVKDFVWKKNPTGWRESWCNLGEGMVGRAFIDFLKTTDYRGPISQHHEYPLGDRAQMAAHMKRDLRVLLEWMA